MNIVYALLFITAGVVAFTAIALTLDALLDTRGQRPPRTKPEQPRRPRPERKRLPDQPDLNSAGEVALYLDTLRTREEREAKPC